MNAVTISGAGGYHSGQALSSGRQGTATVDAGPAAAALASLTPTPLPVPTLAETEGQSVTETDFGLLYGPDGLPQDAPPAPSHAAPAAGGSIEANLANSRDPSARLAMESTQLTALLSSLMSTADTAQTASAPPPETDAAQLSRVTQNSLIARLYSQF